MASDTPRTVAVCEKLIAWATKNPNATIGDVAKFIVETFTEDMAEVERELNEAQKTITEFREWSIGGVAASEWKNRAETAEAKLAALQMERDSLDSSTKRLTTETRELCALFRKATGYTVDEYTAMLKEVSTGKSETRLGNAALQVKPEVAGLVNSIRALRSARHEWENAPSSELLTLDAAIDALLSLSAQLAEKEAECEGLRQDAERYRFLRDEEYDEHLLNYLVAPKIHRDSVDAAIDSARKESK